jgi:NTP pyrophosphatase (non-canonical NTP hydrolase)
MSSAQNTLEILSAELLAFARERDWEQFHSPKNLAMSLAIEAAELMEHFQWLDGAQSKALPPVKHEAAALEMADVLIYLIRLAEVLGVDLEAAVRRKMAINAGRYPVAASRGTSLKYDELPRDPAD